METIKESNGVITIEKSYGDDLEIQFTLVDGSSVPIDLTGKVMVLGIENKNEVLLEVTGTVSSNEVTFDVPYSVYGEPIPKIGTYYFDFWSETDRVTYMKKGVIKFIDVAHEV